MLRTNFAGDHIIEVETSGERTTIFPHMITSYGPEENHPEKFFIEYKVIK